MTSLFTELLKFFSEFSWRKFVSILVMLLIALIVFSVYEYYTSAFRFNRLQKAAELLSRLQEINSHGTNNNVDLEKAKMTLIKQSVEAINSKPITLQFLPSTLKFSPDVLYKFLAGASFWCLTALTQFKRRSDPEKRKIYLGMLTVGIITGLTGIFIKSIWWPWFHILILPWIVFIVMLLSLVPIGFLASKKTTTKNPVT